MAVPMADSSPSDVIRIDRAVLSHTRPRLRSNEENPMNAFVRDRGIRCIHRARSARACAAAAQQSAPATHASRPATPATRPPVTPRRSPRRQPRRRSRRPCSNPSAAATERSVDLDELLTRVSEATGKEFLVDPRVRARVYGVPKIDNPTYAELLTILRIHGYVAVEVGRAREHRARRPRAVHADARC